MCAVGELTTLFPQKVVEKPITHFAGDFDILKSCLLAHRSVVPNLYHTLTHRRDTSGSTRGYLRCLSQEGTQWSNCLRRESSPSYCQTFGAADIKTTSTWREGHGAEEVQTVRELSDTVKVDIVEGDHHREDLITLLPAYPLPRALNQAVPDEYSLSRYILDIRVQQRCG